MGASFETRVYPTSLGMAKIKEVWNNEVERSLYEDGHNYSGGIGMLGKGFDLKRKTFDDGHKAQEHILENQEKWDGAMACIYEDEDGVEWVMIGGWCSS
jgi:hypothetical protein